LCHIDRLGLEPAIGEIADRCGYNDPRVRSQIRNSSDAT